MKVRSLMMTIAALLICNYAVAQSHIKAVVKELEEIEGVGSKVVKRDPKTKKITCIVLRFSFYSKEGKYAEKLKKAFHQDAEDAKMEAQYRDTHILQFEGGSFYILKIDKAKAKDGAPLVELSVYAKGEGAESDDFSSFENIMKSSTKFDTLGLP